MEFCSFKGLSKFYLEFLNAFLFIVAFIALIYSAVTAGRLHDYDEVFGKETVIVPLAFSCLIIVSSFIGLVGACYQNRCLLFVYLVLAFLGTLLVLSFGIVMLAYSEKLDNIDNKSVGEAKDSVEAKIIDFELAVYQKCCASVYELEYPVLCSENDEKTCINDEEDFSDFYDSLSGDICDALEDVEIDDVSVVGDPEVEDGACGNGDPGEFVDMITQFLEENIKAFGVTALILSILMIIDLLATLILICMKKEVKKEETKKMEYKEKEADRMAQGDYKSIQLS